MKRVLLSLALLLPLTAPAPPYSIDWHRIAGGGGTSTNSQYSLDGTIGQHDASPTISGGSYSIVSGYWSLFAGQTINAPLLRMFLTSTNTAVVFWPSPSSGWNLRQTATLPNGTWSVPAEAIQDNGTNRFIIVNPLAGSRYYRLSRL
jgi:hypothetical protein